MVVNWFSTLDQHAMDYNDTLMFGWWSKPTPTSLAGVDELLIFCLCWLFIDVDIFERYDTTCTSLEFMKGWSCVDFDFSLMLGNLWQIQYNGKSRVYERFTDSQHQCCSCTVAVTDSQHQCCSCTVSVTDSQHQW